MPVAVFHASSNRAHVDVAHAVDIASVAGTVSRRELLAAGARPSSIGAAVRSGRLQRVGRGLYATGPGRELLRLGGEIGVLSHRSAALLLGADVITKPDKVEITVAHRRSSAPGWAQLHRARLSAADQIVLCGLTVTSPLRTLADLARALPQAEAVVAADSMLRTAAVTWSEIEALRCRVRGPGSARVRAVLDATDDLSGSALESLLRLVLVDAGLRPERQVTIRGFNGVVGRVDFLFRADRLVVEADGFAFHSSPEQLRNDLRRGNALQECGFRLLRFGWSDVRSRPDQVVQTVRRTLAQSTT